MTKSESGTLLSWLKVTLTYTVIFTYSFNILTISFLVYLATRSFDLHAALAPPAPIEYSCPTGYSLSNGICIKKQQRASSFQCLTAGYSLASIDGKAVCKKSESRTSINVCPSNGISWIDLQRNWDFTDPAYPQFCTARLSGTSLPNCNIDYRDAFTNGVCFKLQNPLGKTCPDDGGDAETVELTCPQSYQDVGLCSAGETVTKTIPDQNWVLATNSNSCSRNLYETAVETCDAGFQKVDVGICEKIETATSYVGCPSGYFQDGSQCQAGTLPTCPVGTTYENGSCLTSTGKVDSCTNGKELDPFSNLCIEARNTHNDVDYYTQIGLDMGKHAVAAVSIPETNSGGGYDLKTKVLDPNIPETVVNVQDSDTLGLDANNAHPVSASDTYQNNDEQNKSIRAAIKRNQEYRNATPLVGATEEETNDLQDHSAVAYLTLMDTQNLNPPQQIGSDAAFLQQGFSEVNAVRNGDGGRFFGDCSDDTVDYQEVTDGSLVKTSSSCFKPNRNNLSSCMRKRILTPPNQLAIEGFDASYMSYCGPNCLQIAIGSDLEGSLVPDVPCKVFHWGTYFRIAEDYTVTNATLVKTFWDDHFLFQANNIDIKRDVYGTFPGGFPKTSTSISCEREVYHTDRVPKDVTSEFNLAVASDPNKVVNLTVDVAVGGRGAGYALLQVHFDKPITDDWQEEITESPDGCEAALTTPDSFCTASEWFCDARLKSDLVNNSLYTNISEASGSGTVRDAEYGDAIVMVMRRDFNPVNATGKNSNCGLIIATTDGDVDGNDDDGLMVCEDAIGLSTHRIRDSPAVKGTKLTNILPEKNMWTTFAFQINGDGKGATFFTKDGTKHLSSTVLGGNFDRLELSRIAVARGTSENDWSKRATEPFYVGYWEVLNSPTDQNIYAAIERIHSKYKINNLEPLFDGDDGIVPCMLAHIEDYQCDPLKGQRLPFESGSVGYNEILNLSDSCEPFQRNSRCVYDTAVCTDGWLDGSTGICYGWDIDYTCESGNQVIVNRTKENNTCFSDTECVGNDCAHKADESNTDFVQTAAMYASINELDNDRKCTDPSDPTTCQVFIGSAEYCSWDQLRVNDCCSLDGLDTQANLFKGTMTLFSAGQYAATAEGAFVDPFMADNYVAKGWDMVKSSWKDATEYMESVTDPLITSAAETAESFWSTVSKPFISEAESIAGNTATEIVVEEGTETFIDAAGAAVEAAMDSVYEYVYDLMPEVLQEAVASAASALGMEATEEVGADALKYVSEYAANVLGFIMFLYTMYQLIKLVYTLLTACKEEELQMPTNLKEGKCFFAKHVPCEKTLGICTTKAKNQYCCFASTISRIIMEQAVVQIGSSPQEWHDIEQCRGFTLNELSDVDFSQINFDEWIGLMVESGSFPEDLSVEKVTSAESMVNNKGRDSTSKRMLDRFPNSEGVELREMYNTGSIETNIDCNSSPKPAVCGVGVELPGGG